MTDEQIINIFKYCNESDSDDCYNCTARQNGKCTVPDLGIQVSQVINRQKAENERLRAELDKYPVKTLFDNNSVICSKTSEDYDKLIMDISNNAIKEFARELKCGVPQETGVIRCKDIDDLVKQMTEVKENEKYCKRSLLKGGAK